MTNKPSRNIDEQINLLKSRGMLFRDENAARGILKNISYYRLKGYWWDMQKDISNHIFIQNVCFEDVNRTMVKTPTRVVNPRLPWLQINLSEYQKKRPFLRDNFQCDYEYADKTRSGLVWTVKIYSESGELLEVHKRVLIGYYSKAFNPPHKCKRNHNNN